MLQRFFKGEFRELFQYISPVAFKVIDWKPMLVPLRKAASDYLKRNPQSGLRSHLLNYLPNYIKLVEQRSETKEPSPNDNKAIGEAILFLYFRQLQMEEGLFLDLKKKQFQNNGNHILWNPEGPIHKFKDGFRQGLWQLYSGYYGGDQKLMKEGLVRVGLLRDSSSEEMEKEVSELLFSHWGSGDQREVSFQLAHFRESFHNLFLYLRKHKITLSSDFMFLGINLITMYRSLEPLKESFDVRGIFDEVSKSEIP